MNVRIKIEDGIPTKLRSVMRMASGGELSELHHAAGTEVQRITVDHIRALGGSEYYAEAAKKVAGSSALASGPAAAILTINHPGFSRAFRDVKIVPREAKSLAIPIHPMARGHRAKELWDRMQLFIPKKKDGKSANYIAATIGGAITPFYVLCKSVTQKQDRSLLPSDAQFQAAAVLGAKGWLKMKLGGQS